MPELTPMFLGSVQDKRQGQTYRGGFIAGANFSALVRTSPEGAVFYRSRSLFADSLTQGDAMMKPFSLIICPAVLLFMLGCGGNGGSGPMTLSPPNEEIPPVPTTPTTPTTPSQPAQPPAPPSAPVPPPAPPAPPSAPVPPPAPPVPPAAPPAPPQPPQPPASPEAMEPLSDEEERALYEEAIPNATFMAPIFSQFVSLVQGHG